MNYRRWRIMPRMARTLGRIMTKGTLIAIPQKLQFGPAMEALNERQRMFVLIWNEGGHKNAVDAVREAGYDANTGADRVQATRLLQNPKIKAAIVEDIQGRMCGDLAEMYELMRQLAKESGPHQFHAIKYIAAQAGLIERMRTEIDVTVTTQTFEQKVERLRQLAVNAGDDPTAVLAEVGVTIDADFEIVSVEDAEPAEKDLW